MGSFGLAIIISLSESPFSRVCRLFAIAFAIAFANRANIESERESHQLGKLSLLSLVRSFVGSLARSLASLSLSFSRLAIAHHLQKNSQHKAIMASLVAVVKIKMYT